jgi:hypothetical protein
MSVEGIAEVSAVKGVIPAEYADAIGGQVNVVSKSGTNAWHGSLFENNQSSALSARFQFASTKPQLTLNQFGGSLGGPIKKNKIFIFGDYEGYRDTQGTFVNGNVPTAAVRDELIKAVPAYQLALQAFPLPNQPAASGATVGTFSAIKPLIRNDNHVDARGDMILTDNSRLSISYNRGTPYQSTPRYYNNDAQLYVNSLNRGNVSYIVGGSQWTSETRFGYDRTIQDRLDQFFKPQYPHREHRLRGARARPSDKPRLERACRRDQSLRGAALADRRKLRSQYRASLVEVWRRSPRIDRYAQ